MAKTSVYLPDDLAELARAYGIPVSEVAQRAVREAVRKAQIKESVMTDIRAVAERLQAARTADAEAAEVEAARVRRRGAEWARGYATEGDLEYVTGYDGPAAAYHAPQSLVAYQYSVSAEGDQWEGETIPVSPGEAHWPDLQAGAREVWDAVRSLLIEVDKQPTSASDRTGGHR